MASVIELLTSDSSSPFAVPFAIASSLSARGKASSCAGPSCSSAEMRRR